MNSSNNKQPKENKMPKQQAPKQQQASVKQSQMAKQQTLPKQNNSAPKPKQTFNQDPKNEKHENLNQFKEYHKNDFDNDYEQEFNTSNKGVKNAVIDSNVKGNNEGIKISFGDDFDNDFDVIESNKWYDDRTGEGFATEKLKNGKTQVYPLGTGEILSQDFDNEDPESVINNYYKNTGVSEDKIKNMGKFGMVGIENFDNDVKDDLNEFNENDLPNYLRDSDYQEDHDYELDYLRNRDEQGLNNDFDEYSDLSHTLNELEDLGIFNVKMIDEEGNIVFDGNSMDAPLWDENGNEYAISKIDKDELNRSGIIHLKKGDELFDDEEIVYDPKNNQSLELKHKQLEELIPEDKREQTKLLLDYFVNDLGIDEETALDSIIESAKKVKKL